ncbi:Protein of unknown function (DUF2628) [Synechococcus sp. PCC 7502]|uniref:hypothetical protein n=1 Tax=Synechococcus sp. PCC 7502 TaxID=1173263 RepID=UPI00029FA34C|nr:hypothetical protein [Synechococcus sp. PCC 7502]AFY72702.1 Protein of unknown function (DUF2628) [Synechococcus sp. PCC 7502]
MNNSKVPEGINKWNWGAFLLTPFWLLSHQEWVGLICWLPHLIFNINLALLMSSHNKLLGANLIIFTIVVRPILFIVYICVALYFGVYGNVRFWGKTNLTSVKEFRIHQRKWAIGGICFGIPYSLLNFYLWERFIDWEYFIINQY